MSVACPPMPAARLVQEEARVGQAVAVFLRGADEDQGARACDPAGPDHTHLGFDELDHVVNHVARLDVAAGRGNDHVDRIVACLGKGEQLGDRTTGQLVVDRAGDDHVAALEEQGLGLAPAGALSSDLSSSVSSSSTG